MSQPPTPASSAPPKPRRASRRAKLLLACASVCFTLLLLEAGCRVFVWAQDKKLERDWQRLDEERKDPKGKVTLGDIVQRSSNPGLIYELRPNVRDVVYTDVPVSTNSKGCRGPERPVAKPKNALRIVVIGDSVAFGHGVEEPDLKFRLLETALRKRYPDHQVDLVNLAVPGYNTAMEVEALATKGLEYQPDLVFVDFCGNDTYLPNFIWSERNYLDLSHSYVVDLVRRAVAKDASPWAPGPLSNAPARSDGHGFENDPALVPPRYSYMVGWQGWRRAMERLVDLGKKHGFAIVLTTQMQLEPYIVETCGQLGVWPFSPEPVIRAYMAEHHIEKYIGPPLTLSVSDAHPTALHNRIEFEALWDLVEKFGMLDTVLAKRK